MTKRQVIASEFVRLLSAVTKLGGYKVDFPTAKHWSPVIEPKENELFVNVKDRIDIYAETAEGLTQQMNVEVQLGCCITSTNTLGYSGDTKNYDCITDMIDDVIKCVYDNMRSLQTSFDIIDIVPISTEPDVDLFEREVGAGKVVFKITHQQHAVWIYDDTNYPIN